MKGLAINMVQSLEDQAACECLVEHAAELMLAKFELKRREGAGGWHDAGVSINELYDSLQGHVVKGDMVDVLNIAAMIKGREDLYGERLILARATAAASAPSISPAKAASGLVQIGNDLMALSPGEGEVAGYIDYRTGLMWGPTLGQLNHADAKRSCEEYRLFGYKNWRMPTRKEQYSLVEDGRRDPCSSPLILDMKSSSYYWTDTPVPGNEDYFFVVDFSLGFVNNGHRLYRHWVRPVRSLSPSGQ